MKPTILHFIVDLRRGGAETMLVSTLRELTEYNNIVVTLGNKNEYADELECAGFESMNLRQSLLIVPEAVFLFRRILKKYRPALVHSHLPISNFIARLATPSSIPLITTLHTLISHDYKKWILRIIDKITLLYKPSTILGCSQVVLNDYFSTLKLKPRNSILLYNPIKTESFLKKNTYDYEKPFKLICVGSLKEPKNLPFLIKAMSLIKRKPIELHIFGKGSLRSSLQHQIQDSGANVILHDQVTNINEILKDFDLFTLSSLWEGFSISVLEAMSSKIPMLLSDIPSFREQAGDAACYFSLSDLSDFGEKVTYLMGSQHIRENLSSAAYKKVTENFTLEHHLKSLRQIYSRTINTQTEN